MPIARDDEGRVPLGCACPLCGERDRDRLVWLDDERVRCTMCGTEYDPNDERAAS